MSDLSFQQIVAKEPFFKLVCKVLQSGIPLVSFLLNETKRKTNVLSVDNFRRGLHSYLWYGAKTRFGVCLTEVKHCL
jgi:hypothetical protein